MGNSHAKTSPTPSPSQKRRAREIEKRRKNRKSPSLDDDIDTSPAGQVQTTVEQTRMKLAEQDRRTSPAPAKTTKNSPSEKGGNRVSSSQPKTMATPQQANKNKRTEKVPRKQTTTSNGPDRSKKLPSVFYNKTRVRNTCKGDQKKQNGVISATPSLQASVPSPLPKKESISSPIAVAPSEEKPIVEKKVAVFKTTKTSKTVEEEEKDGKCMSSLRTLKQQKLQISYRLDHAGQTTAILSQSADCSSSPQRQSRLKLKTPEANQTKKQLPSVFYKAHNRDVGKETPRSDTTPVITQSPPSSPTSVISEFRSNSFASARARFDKQKGVASKTIKPVDEQSPPPPPKEESAKTIEPAKEQPPQPPPPAPKKQAPKTIKPIEKELPPPPPPPSSPKRKVSKRIKPIEKPRPPPQALKKQVRIMEEHNQEMTLPSRKYELKHKGKFWYTKPEIAKARQDFCMMQQVWVAIDKKLREMEYYEDPAMLVARIEEISLWEPGDIADFLEAPSPESTIIIPAQQQQTHNNDGTPIRYHVSSRFVHV